MCNTRLRHEVQEQRYPVPRPIVGQHQDKEKQQPEHSAGGGQLDRRSNEPVRFEQDAL